MYESINIEIENIDHLGIIAGIVDEVGIVEIVNQKLPSYATEKISKGLVVKAMILNALGFVSQPLYLFSEFFNDKAIEKLLGKEVKKEYLNDDKLGRSLDELYEYGLSNLFIEIVIEVIKKYQIKSNYHHLDSTSFHVDGKYENEEEENRKTIKICHGYSKDNRPDLKQCVLNLIVSGDGEIPLWMKSGQGNQSDKKEFVKIVKEYKKSIETESITVCDSALYSQENIQLLGEMKWITRVPLTVKKGRELVENEEILWTEIENEQEQELKERGYEWKVIKENYGGINQRWLVVENKKRKESDLKKIKKAIPLEKEEVEKEKKKISRKLWCDNKECEREIKKKNKRFKYYELEIEDIRKQEKGKYEVSVVVREKEEEIEKKKNQAGRFILATNVMEEERLKPWEILWEYKQQQKVERGFRFLKNPLFFTESFYVKKVERLEGILWLMSLSLLIYNLAQREMRKELKRRKVGLRNQLGKRTEKVTMRWIFQCFQGIYLAKINEEERIVNMNKDREEILEYLPAKCREYYQ
ncbi:IS1634 family transposase [Cyanobacterium sp. IPPAS B-1200]|uniref:IS1634 family transposase n=1 Tax=Cyanobacterium sp. IPPAS B-1200 TaxID=1562720 RepID=UPI003D5BC76D